MLFYYSIREKYIGTDNPLLNNRTINFDQMYVRRLFENVWSRIGTVWNRGKLENWAVVSSMGGNTDWEYMIDWNQINQKVNYSDRGTHGIFLHTSSSSFLSVIPPIDETTVKNWYIFIRNKPLELGASIHMWSILFYLDLLLVNLVACRR